MIDFYTWDTSNGQRVAIMLEECGLPYRTHRIDLMKGESREAPFLAINPAGQIPVIVDPDGPAGVPLMLTQSAAILIYLAEKTRRFMPAEPLERARMWEALAFAMTDVAPASASVFFGSMLLPDKSPANLAWFEERVLRFFRLADARLAQSDYLAGELSIADFALYPVVAVRRKLIDREAGFDALNRWSAKLSSRPALARAMQEAA